MTIRHRLVNATFSFQKTSDNASRAATPSTTSELLPARLTALEAAVTECAAAETRLVAVEAAAAAKRELNGLPLLILSRAANSRTTVYKPPSTKVPRWIKF